MVLSLAFFAFLLTGPPLYWSIKSQILRNIFLICLSFSFLAIYDLKAVALVLASSVFSYAVATHIERSDRKRLHYTLGLLSLIALLIAFKYLAFLNQSLTVLFSPLAHLPSLHLEQIAVPLGISYLAFKHISFITDVYDNVTTKGTFIDFLNYSSLFTIYVAGPIERYQRFLPQSSNPNLAWKGQFLDSGFSRVVYGIFKKAVIADWIGHFIRPIWASYGSHSLFTQSLALLGFSLQIYVDFSAYSDIAIGSSRLFGFKIMENFDNPYLKPNIGQFWRTWHISLSDWIRDYIFFPLGRISSRKLWLLFFVPLIAMALCGLWHGAAWHFVLWGVWHGAGLSALQLWNQYKKRNKILATIAQTKSFNFASIALTFLFVTVGWLFFK